MPDDMSTDAPVAFVCAMPMEVVPLEEKLSLEKSQVGSLELYTGSVGGRPAVAIVTGMGTVLAREGLEKLLAAMPVERVLVVGITGAVDDETPIGTLILPEVVTNSATGAEFRPAALGDGTPSGTMWTTDILITDADVIAGLRSRGVVSLDMETAAIAEVCEGRNIPWSVFRAISDRATDGSVNEEIFRLANQDGTPNMEAITAYFEEHPERVAAMTQMGENATRAASVAADAAIASLPSS
jgi:adenosylhomocysteine nucleosidase